ncbi:hypothetical protein ONS95_014427 [Cadophora gregata]|uniref:uncharacterized protein n=1 Tax=Cadophora gregata TaxID=51156 RepID=UPI0026DA8D9F|nr:uncharacterized protein ONS95_014427 [Cadophora gregata]KAK0112688.1 hypothetical protein ONS95_014427 [Cadophora gregata]KAK0124822.1 hypothetical protein ONS96_008703 [Cadophora gregata f. sp. sojae]
MPSKIATPEEYLPAHLALLAKEKQLRELSSSVAAERRALPMVHIIKPYAFTSPTGPTTLKDLFGTKSQLIIYRYMFEPTAEEGCQGGAKRV